VGKEAGMASMVQTAMGAVKEKSAESKEEGEERLSNSPP